MHELRIRHIINSDTLTISGLTQFVGEEVDILVSTRMNKTRKKISVTHKKSAAARLSKYKNIRLREKEADIWTAVVREKYANS